MKVVWTHQALVRLTEILEFVAQDSESAAERLMARLTEGGEGLAAFPESGRRVPELPASHLRELIDGNYRIVYRVRESTIEILTVFEGHRLLPAEDLARAPKPAE